MSHAVNNIFTLCLGGWLLKPIISPSLHLPTLLFNFTLFFKEHEWRAHWNCLNIGVWSASSLNLHSIHISNHLSPAACTVFVCLGLKLPLTEQHQCKEKKSKVKQKKNLKWSLHFWKTGRIKEKLTRIPLTWFAPRAFRSFPISSFSVIMKTFLFPFLFRGDLCL